MPTTYYGQNIVKHQSPSEYGEEYTMLELDNEKLVHVLTAELENLLTPEIRDLTELRRVRTLPVIQSILLLMKRYNIRQDETEFTLAMVAESLNQNMTQASNKLWGVEHFGEMTFQDIDKVLKKQ